MAHAFGSSQQQYQCTTEHFRAIITSGTSHAGPPRTCALLRNWRAHNTFMHCGTPLRMQVRRASTSQSIIWKYRHNPPFSLHIILGIGKYLYCRMHCDHCRSDPVQVQSTCGVLQRICMSHQTTSVAASGSRGQRDTARILP